MRESPTALEPLTQLLKKIGLAEVEAVLECLIERRHLKRILTLPNRTEPYKVSYGVLDHAFWYFHSGTSELKDQKSATIISATQFALIQKHADALLEYTP